MRETDYNEKRLSHRLVHYWHQLKGDRDELPDINTFNHHAVEDLWPACLRVVITKSGEHNLYKYEFIGEDIKRIYGKDLTGQQVTSTIRVLPGASVLSALDTPEPLSEPALEQGQFINEDHKVVKYRSCVLPFGNQNLPVSHAIIGLSWRTFS